MGGSTATGGGSGTGIDERPGAPCTTVADCQLMNDCCTCDVYSDAASPATCDVECDASKCEVMGIGTDEIACVAGRCVFSRSCDWRQVQCNMVEPNCPVGEVASVTNGCYGPCLPTSRCAAVASCSVCTEQGLACATIEGNLSNGPTYHCVIAPQNCSSEPTCDCMGVCVDYLVCNVPSSRSLYCSCPTC